MFMFVKMSKIYTNDKWEQMKIQILANCQMFTCKSLSWKKIYFFKINIWF